MFGRSSTANNDDGMAIIVISKCIIYSSLIFLKFDHINNVNWNLVGTSEIINLLKLLANAGSTPMRSNSNSIGLLSIRLMFSTLIRFDRFSTTFFFAFLPSGIKYY